MSSQLDVALVALIVSLAALVIAFGQLLQQYFSTAEGYRSCREDVLGSWSNLVKPKFDFRNLRYETRWVSRAISLTNPTKFYSTLKDDTTDFGKLLPVGHSSLPGGVVHGNALPSARVSWLALLEHVRSYQYGVYSCAFEHVVAKDITPSNAEKGQGHSLSLDEWFDQINGQADSALSLPVARREVISWDFMPPDAMKPFATISLHDLLVLGYRLGLDWTEVDPDNDRLIAQDDSGNDISAHRIRGLGLMIQFQHDSGRNKFGDEPYVNKSMAMSDFKLSDIMVPSAEADKLAFGIIPGDQQLGLDDVLVATREHCLDYVGMLDERLDRKPRNARELLSRSFNTSDITKSGLDQLMPLISPCLLLPGCKTTTVRQPSKWCQVGILEIMEGFIVYRHRIEAMRDNDTVSAVKKASIGWILDTWASVEELLQKPFTWAAFRS